MSLDLAPDTFPILLAVVEQSPVGVALLDPDGVVSYENVRLRETVGVRTGWTGEAIDDLTGLSPSLRDAMKALAADGTPFQDVESTYDRPDGSCRDLVASGVPVRGLPELPAVCVVTVLDVTEQRAGEEALALGERVEAAESALRHDALRRPDVLALLESALARTGAALEADGAVALIGASADDLYIRCAAWPSEAPPALSELAPSERPVPRSGRPRTATHADSPRLVDGLGSPHALVVTVEGGASGAFVLGRDRPWSLAEQAAASRLTALFSTLWTWAETESRFQRTVADLDEALFTFGYDGDRRTYAFVTAQVEALVGLDPDAILAGDVDWTDLVVDEDRARFDAHDACLRAGLPSSVEVRLRLDGGDAVWVSERATPSLDAAGRPVAGGLLADVTAQKEAEAKLDRARRLAERAAQTRMAFLRMMSHELRTPLGSIRGFAELLRDEVRDLDGAPPEVHEFAETIGESARHALRLVSDLLDLSRLETGALDLGQSPVDLSGVACAVGARYAPHAAEAGVVLTCETGPGLALGDPARVEQVVDQLVSNAVKFTPSGAITLRVVRHEGSVCLHVTDTGVGIGAGFVDSLFEPFAQEDARVNRQYEGSGLGLAIAHRLARQMGGALQVQSEKGCGSTFSFSLPTA